MNSTQLKQFVQQYFEANQCQIIENHPSYLRAQLSIPVDKDIMNRPYYWMFVERTGAEPAPQQVTFVFDDENCPEGVNGELIKFGCWRMHLIFQSAQKMGSYIRLYEKVDWANQTQALHPWLLINYKISFISDQKKDIYYPIGFNLITGHILTNFDQILDTYNLTPKIPDYHFTLSPIFSLASAIPRIEQHIENFLEQEDHTWAREADQRLDEEEELIRQFFAHQEDKDEALRLRLAEIEAYRPKINISPINVGLVYLLSDPLTKFRA